MCCGNDTKNTIDSSAHARDGGGDHKKVYECDASTTLLHLVVVVVVGLFTASSVEKLNSPPQCVCVCNYSRVFFCVCRQRASAGAVDGRWGVRFFANK